MILRWKFHVCLYLVSEWKDDIFFPERSQKTHTSQWFACTSKAPFRHLLRESHIKYLSSAWKLPHHDMCTLINCVEWIRKWQWVGWPGVRRVDGGCHIHVWSNIKYRNRPRTVIHGGDSLHTYDCRYYSLDFCLSFMHHVQNPMTASRSLTSLRFKAYRPAPHCARPRDIPFLIIVERLFFRIEQDRWIFQRMFASFLHRLAWLSWGGKDLRTWAPEWVDVNIV